jgi:DnaJ homolog subfamily A member 2
MFNFGRPPKNPGTKLYEVLEVSQTATESEIKKSYKKMSMQYHPDRPTGDAEKFKQINKAKDVLLDPKKREIYDEYGEEGLDNNPDGQPDMPDDLIDLIMPGMRRQRAQQGPKKSKNMGVKLEVSLEDLYTGKTMPFEFNRYVKCSDCKATGANDPSDISDCESCKGKGQQVRMTQMGPMITQQIMPCNDCQGKGKRVKKGKECNKCNGKKMAEEVFKTEVVIRAGMNNGDQICLKGKAHQHPDCDETGDLVLIVEELPSENGLIRNGNDLIYEKNIDLVDALCGIEFYIKQLDGRYLKASYDDVISSEQLLKIDSEGMPILDDMNCGDMFVRFKVTFPLSLDGKRKKLLRKILQKTSSDIMEVEPDKDDDVEDKVLEPIDDSKYHINDGDNPFMNMHSNGDSDGEQHVECAQQ